MNQRAVDVLIKAGLEGVRQCVGDYKRADGAMCAQGVLIQALVDQGRLQWLPFFSDGAFLPRHGHTFRALFEIEYEIDAEECYRIANLNNVERLDFIGIARKLGPA